MPGHPLVAGREVAAELAFGEKPHGSKSRDLFANHLGSRPEAAYRRIAEHASMQGSSD